MRMRREARHYGVSQFRQVAHETAHFILVHPDADEQHASPAPHDNGVHQ